MKGLWRLAGALCVAPRPAARRLLADALAALRRVGASVVSTYAGVPTTRMYVGGFIGTLARLDLIVAATLVAHLIRGAGEAPGCSRMDGCPDRAGGGWAGRWSRP